jgi:hypothetical protein
MALPGNGLSHPIISNTDRRKRCLVCDVPIRPERRIYGFAMCCLQPGLHNRFVVGRKRGTPAYALTQIKIGRPPSGWELQLGRRFL